MNNKLQEDKLNKIRSEIKTLGSELLKTESKNALENHYLQSVYEVLASLRRVVEQAESFKNHCNQILIPDIHEAKLLEKAKNGFETNWAVFQKANDICEVSVDTSFTSAIVKIKSSLGI